MCRGGGSKSTNGRFLEPASSSTSLSTTVGFPPENDDREGNLRSVALIATAAAASAATVISTLSSSNKIGWLVRATKILLGIAVISVASGSVLYLTHSGFRRTIQFWRAVVPLWAEYKILKIKNGTSEGEGQLPGGWEYEFHRRAAPKLVAVMMKLGGIYVKIGQFLSTVGAALLEDAYVQELRPLQDGMPPRDPQEIQNIVEKSLGISHMNEVFESFDPMPIGAASIAQAHRGVLQKEVADRVGFQDVIVKVQYPEVAEQYDADFANVLLAVRLWNPDVLQTVGKLRERHRNELDFNIEADHLRLVSSNMRRRNLEPQLVRIPRVADDLATRHVLVMEFLPGTSLSSAIQEELDDVAAAMGLKDAEELRAKIMQNVKTQYMKGEIGSDDLSRAEIEANDDGGGSGVGILMNGGKNNRKVPSLFQNRGGAIQLGPNQQRLLTSIAAPLLRSYAGARRRAQNAWDAITRSEHAPRRRSNVDLNRALKTLVRVHGVQVLLDGVYNADPHPGNVLIMSDGRLGLIDYGMVGRLDKEERRLIASTIVALGDDDAETVVRNYRDSGYAAGTINGPDHPDTMYLRMARFHMDRVDLSPVEMHDGEKVEVLAVLQKTVERSIPDYVEQMKRIGGLMIGVTAQAGRPTSLAREWRPMAEEVLEEHGQKAKKRGLFFRPPVVKKPVKMIEDIPTASSSSSP